MARKSHARNARDGRTSHGISVFGPLSQLLRDMGASATSGASGASRPATPPLSDKQAAIRAHLPTQAAREAFDLAVQSGLAWTPDGRRVVDDADDSAAYESLADGVWDVRSHDAYATDDDADDADNPPAYDEIDDDDWPTGLCVVCDGAGCAHCLPLPRPHRAQHCRFLRRERARRATVRRLVGAYSRCQCAQNAAPSFVPLAWHRRDLFTLYVAAQEERDDDSSTWARENARPQAFGSDGYLPCDGDDWM